MPCSPHATYDSKESEFLALEDFLHTISDSLWHTLWDENGPSPYSLWCPRYSGYKFYTVEKAISRRRLDLLCGAALVSKNDSGSHVRWDQLVQFALFRPHVMNGNELMLSSSSICEALFFGTRILLARTLSKYATASSDCVYVLVLASNYEGVVTLQGDMGKLEFTSGNPYLSVGKWIKYHVEVNVSPVDRVWNKLGNVNWRDLGSFQILLATFYSMVQWSGEAKRSIMSLALDHSLRIHQRSIKRRIDVESERSMVPFHHDAEIVVVDEKHDQDHRLKLKQGEVLELEDLQDQDRDQKSFQVHKLLQGWNGCCYGASALEFPTEPLMLYVGAHPTRLEPSWEDMKSNDKRKS